MPCADYQRRAAVPSPAVRPVNAIDAGRTGRPVRDSGVRQACARRMGVQGTAVSRSKGLSTPAGYHRYPLRSFGAQIAAHGRVAHLHCALCDRLERIQADSESFLRAYGMTCEDMVDGV